jgi:hypothetical protein
MALAREGIPASLGNATFLSWFWHNGNAVGGVTVYVRRSDAERARRVLAEAGAKATDSPPPWICSSCGQRVAGQWDACWQCGRFADGTPGSGPVEELAAQPEGRFQAAPWLNLSRLFTLAAVVVISIRLLTSGTQPLFVLVPVVVVFAYLLRQFELPAGWPSELHQVAEPSDRSSPILPTTPSAVSRAIVQRAWQAAVFAIAFPPLGFYSMRLLWKLGGRDTPLGWADTWRSWTAFLLNVVTILYLLFVLRVLLVLARP